MSYIKSPLNYVGGKYKLLPQIIPLFPKDIDTFYDLFCGGCNVGINVEAKQIVANDMLSPVIDMFQTFATNTKENIFKKILEIIEIYELSDSTKQTYADYGCDSSDGLGKYNKDAYLKLRQDYNLLRDRSEKSFLFYTLCCYSFSNHIRFNSSGGFNVPYGKRDFNSSMRENLNKFLDHLKKINITFTSLNFQEFNITNFKPNDFIYCDPPYLITTANYNENGGWHEIKEYELLNYLDNANNNNIKFALSNVLEHKGKSNDILKEWSKKYTIHNLSFSYSNSNYNTKNRDKNSTQEVLITNY